MTCIMMTRAGCQVQRNCATTQRHGYRS